MRVLPRWRPLPSFVAIRLIFAKPSIQMNDLQAHTQPIIAFFAPISLIRQLNPDHDGVFVAIQYGTDQSFDVVHTISKQRYNRQNQYKVTSITHPAVNSYLWEGFMLNDPRVIMTGHLWENDGVWMYTENQRFTDGRPPKMATPPVVCRNTVDLRQAVERNEQPARQYADTDQQPAQRGVEKDEVPAVSPERQQSNPQPQNTFSPAPRYSQASLPNCNDPDVLQVVKKLTSTHIIGISQHPVC